MNSAVTKRSNKRQFGAPEWIWEVLIVATISPGIVFALLSISGSPVA